MSNDVIAAAILFVIVVVAGYGLLMHTARKGEDD